MTPNELFERLENTGNMYSYFKRGRKYVYFSTGGWSENEELVSELEKEVVWSMLIFSWRRGGHYTFEIPNKELLDYDMTRRTR